MVELNTLFDMIVGLGNPGLRYAKTRHNLGFMVVDHLAEKLGASWREWGKGSSGRVAEASFGAGSEKKRVLLFEPLSFMNLSGEPVAEVASFYQFAPERILVVHDDLDLPFGALRLRGGGGEGGHNGLRSLATVLGSKGFARVRVGIGRPEQDLTPGSSATLRETPVVDWVLERFREHEYGRLSAVVECASQACETFCLEGLRVAQNRFNGLIAE